MKDKSRNPNWCLKGFIVLAICCFFELPSRWFVREWVVPQMRDMHLLGEFMQSKAYKFEADDISFILQGTPFLGCLFNLAGLTWGYRTWVLWPATFGFGWLASLLAYAVTPDTSVGYVYLNTMSFLVTPGICTLLPFLSLIVLMAAFGLDIGPEPTLRGAKQIRDWLRREYDWRWG